MFKTFVDLIKYIFANHVGFSKLQAQLVNFIFKSTFTLFLFSDRTPANRFVVSLASYFIVLDSFGLTICQSSIFRSPYLTQVFSCASSFFSKARYLQNYFSQQRKLTSYVPSFFFRSTLELIQAALQVTHLSSKMEPIISKLQIISETL